MLTVNDMMTAIPFTVATDTTLRHVIEIMKGEGCRQLPVLENGRLVGIVTDRDVRLAMSSPMVVHDQWFDQEMLDRITAGDCMTTSPLTVSPDMPAYQAAHMLSLYKFGALPVLDEGTLVGIISVSDFLDYFAERHGKAIVDGI
ncbi:MAG: CBS domain-containing protein [Candidatus Promineifilaceae bacterium]